MKTLKIIMALCLNFVFIANAHAQYFGKNKVRYKKFDFNVVESNTYETYHYLKNDSLIIGFIKDAEQWRKKHSYVFKDSFAYKIPIILYNNHADFQQTSVVSGLIGTSTGGVTEGLKNRVTMPLTPTFTQSNHVLGHELVHAHQYNMIRASDSLSFQNLANIPLWMTEGLAEYMSIGSVDEHTAMWMRDAVAYDYFPAVKDLNESRYFPYRFGHDFWAFVGGTFGDDKIETLYNETARLGLKMAFERELGVSLDTFSVRWKTATENFYKPLIKDRQLDGLGTKLVDKKNGGRLNISPAVSPNGKYFIFLSEKNLFSIDLFLADTKTGKIIKKLRTRTKNSHLDEIDGFESAGAWSPDSKKYAFIVFSKGMKKVVVHDVDRNKVVDEFFIPGVPAFDNLAWSPDGKKMAFTGLVNGQSNLYVMDVKTKEVEQLTHDYYGQIQAVWHPDGHQIAFATDRVGEEFEKPAYRLSVAVMDLKTKKVDYLPLFERSNNLNPLYSNDGKRLYFLSDREGFRDIYEYNFETQTINQLTKFVTGVSGITHMAPALTVSATDDMVYSLYQDSQYNIYNVNRSDITDVQPVLYTDVDHTAAELPSMKTAEVFVDKLLAMDDIPAKTDRMVQEPYRPKFKLDYISSGGVGVAAGRYGTGLVGGVNMLFGDILGNNQLYVGAVLNGEIQDFGAQGAYLNRDGRIGWGGGLSHIPHRYYSYYLSEEVIDYNGQPLEVLAENYNIYRMFQEQAAVFALYPFSKVTRLEASTSSNYYSFRLDRYINYYENQTLYYIGYERQRNLDAGDSFFVQDFSLAYVGDTSGFGMTSPMDGYRYRMEVKQSLGEISMTSLVGDLRYYKYLKPIGIAGRMLSYNRLGNDAGNSLYPPLYLGYETLIRGYTYKAFNRASSIDVDAITPNDLMGSKMLVGSVELRLPFTGPERLAAIKSGFLFSDLNLFFDVGRVWGVSDYYNINRTFDESQFIYSAGISTRINVFGQIIIEPYYAFPLSLKGNSNGVFGINFTPGW
ncbi:MAG: tolB protein precursor [Flavobacteriia bacterium]|nr:MAG: tolB protein precursor [Flavobacteriia bacterium]